jgi:hypothetical protein
MTPHNVIPEQRLMQAVILNAIADACGQPTDTGKPAEIEVYQRRARMWIDDAGSDFRGICDLAGLDPKTVRKFALAHIESGKPFPRVNRVTRIAERNPLSTGAIAARAGVSPTAVGNVLRKDQGSRQMKERVRTAVREITQEQAQPA